MSSKAIPMVLSYELQSGGNMYDLIIIGSGPAGLSAAVYGKRAGLNLLVIEEKPMSGGQILNTYEVDNYLGMPGINGFDMGMQFKEHAENLGAKIVTCMVERIERKEEYYTHPLKYILE